MSGGENPDGGSKTNSIVVPINPTNNLPTLLGHRVDAVPKLPNALNAVVSVVHKDNYNLSPAEKEWLKWHYRLGHVGFKRVQFLMRSGVLAKSPPMRSLHTTIAKLTTPPKCAACLFAKAKRRSVNTATSHHKVTDDAKSLQKNTLYPGQEISVDHYVCSTLG